MCVFYRQGQVRVSGVVLLKQTCSIHIHLMDFNVNFLDARGIGIGKSSLKDELFKKVKMCYNYQYASNSIFLCILSICPYIIYRGLVVNLAMLCMYYKTCIVIQ